MHVYTRIVTDVEDILLFSKTSSSTPHSTPHMLLLSLQPHVPYCKSLITPWIYVSFYL